MKQIQLFGGKRQLLVLFDTITKSNSMKDECKLYQMSASSLKPANKISSGKKEDLVE